MSDPLRGNYDFALGELERDQGSRGRVYRAIRVGSRVLDVGCDTGRLGEILRREKQCEVCGIEPDPRAAAEAANRLDRVDVKSVESAASFAGFTDFDAVLFLDVLEHLYDPWSVLHGARSALRPGGMVLAVIPNVAHVSVVRRLLLGRFDYDDHGTMDRTHLRWFTRKSAAAALERAGLVDVQVDVVPVVPWVQDFPGIGASLAGLLGRWLPDQLGGSLFARGSRS